MKTNKTYIFSALLAVFLIATSAGILSDNGKAGYTGSPSENNCTNCHSSFALNSGGGSIVISSNIPASGYVPGTTYTITTTVSRDGMAVFGLGVECLKTGNSSAGTWGITNSAETQILTAPNQRKNVTHKLNGGLTSNSKAFQFNWTAPVSGTGTVTFYGSGVAGNNTGSNQGDYVYTTSLAVTEDLANAISPSLSESKLSVFPNPTADWINVQSKSVDATTIRIVDINGKTITDAKASETTTIFVKNLASGLYYVQALNKADNVISTQQFVKQ